MAGFPLQIGRVCVKLLAGGLTRAHARGCLKIPDCAHGQYDGGVLLPGSVGEGRMRLALRLQGDVGCGAQSGKDERKGGEA